jgi:type VI secretion system secreted protein VgrG
VQYQETDYAFVKRILAEEGLFFYFDHPTGQGDENATNLGTGEMLVVSDTAQYYPSLEGGHTLTLRNADPDSALGVHGDDVFRFTRTRRVRARAIVQRGYEFLRPNADASDRAVADSSLDPPAGKDGQSGASVPSREQQELLQSAPVQRQTVYVHEGHDTEARSLPEHARLHLEQERARVAEGSGVSWCRRLMPGRRFTLSDATGGAAGGEYAITSVEHRATAPELLPQGAPIYSNQFQCVPATVRMRPPQPRRRLHQAFETARVVGPEGQEIHTDTHGRVKVLFHWDLAGPRADKSSCWLRVSQAWAGPGWGTQFIPRVGMEVLVGFLGGDVDRPVVTGCLYNGAALTPYRLPLNATQSGIRTQSSPEGEGYNELLFDDQKGGELVSIRSQRNLVESALADHRLEVGGSMRAVAAADRIVEVGGKDELTVEGAQVVTVRGASSVSLGGGGTSTIAGDRQTTIAGDDATRVAGGSTVMAAKFAHLLIGHGEPEGHGLVYVNGNYRVAAAQALELSSTKVVRIACGDSAIEIGPEGIRLTAKKITVGAAEGLSAKGGATELSLGEVVEIKGDEIRLFGKDSAVILNEDARMDGRLVKLNCDKKRPEASADSDSEALGTITFKVEPKFQSDDGVPLTLVIATPSGETVEKEVGPDGTAQLEGKKGDKYFVVDIKKNGRSLTKKAT